jgi:hypothetical protein
VIEEQLNQLSGAFNELDTLQAQEAELVVACEQAAAEEQAVLADQSATEKQSVDRLLKARALKDVRASRLDNMRKRIRDHRDLVQYDIGAPLRKAFANYAHSLLMQKEREIMALFNELLPVGSNVNVSNVDLVPASAPVTRVRQVANWCNSTPKADQQEELAELKQLPPLWIAALRKLIEGADPFESASSS